MMTKEDFMTQYNKFDVQKAPKKKLKVVADKEYSVRKACFKNCRNKSMIVLSGDKLWPHLAQVALRGF